MDQGRPDGEERERRWRAGMVAAQAGDRAAYEQLLLELLPGIQRQVARRVGDPTEREDVVQTVLISLHRARHTYRSERPFGPWLRAVVRNAATDWLRARGRRLRHELSADVDQHADVMLYEMDPGGQELSPELESALAALPPQHREAVELLHVEALSVAEAAQRAGVSAGALKVRAHRGYRALRAILGRRDP